MATISSKMQRAINKQINEEMYSAYLYLAMAAYFESIDLPGFANWMRAQVEEETFHYMKFFNYLVDRGGRVALEAIEKPPAEWKGPLDAFQAAFAHEQKISSLIHALVDVAIQERDRPTESMLQWFVDEQVEEEAAVDKIVKALKLGADSPAVLLMLDRELAARIFTPPTAAAAGA